MTKVRNIRRDRGMKQPSALAGALHAQTKREYLLGFDPSFDGRDDNVVTEVVLGNRIRFVSSAAAGNYWNAFVPVRGGQIQVVIRGLPANFRPTNRNVFRGLTRVTRKNDVRNGETIIVTIDVARRKDPELTHELKIYQTVPEVVPSSIVATRTHDGMIAVLELKPEELQEAA